MRIEDILGIHTETTLYESRGLLKTELNKLKSMTWDKAKSFLKKQFDTFNKSVKKAGIEKEVINILNKHMGTRVSTLSSLATQKIVEKHELNEGFTDWWKEASVNLYGALSFYPILMVFLELDKVIKGSDMADPKSIAIYALIWIAVITGKIVSGKLVSDKTNTVKAAAAPSQVR